MKKLLTFILLGGISLLTSGMFADLTIPDADTYSFPYTDVNSTTSQSEINSVGDSENIPGMISAGMVTSERSLLTRLVNLFGLGGYTDNGVPSAIVYLQMIINLLLWLTAFVAFVIVIYSFYMMFFQEDSKGVDQVKKNLKGVAIALVIMGLSRLIVSFIFNFYKARATEANLQMVASTPVSILLV